MKERVGAALSLDKFASAKVSKYDKRKVIQKQMALKAKQVNKYKKLKKRLDVPEGPLDYTPFDPLQEGQQDGRTGTWMQEVQLQEQKRLHHKEHTSDSHKPEKQRQHAEPAAVDSEQQQQQQQHDPDAEQAKRHKKHQKPLSQLQRLADKIAAETADKEQERQQREQALADRHRQQQFKQKQRSQQKHKFFQKTKSGQPVMKYRVDKILAVLESEKGIKR